MLQPALAHLSRRLRSIAASERDPRWLTWYKPSLTISAARFRTAPAFSPSFSCLLCQNVDQRVEVGVACAEAARKEVPAAPGDAHSVGEYLKFADFSRPLHRVDVQAFFDEGHEPRDLLGVVGSSGAVDDFDFQGVLR